MSKEFDGALDRSDARRKESGDGKPKLNKATVSIVIALVGPLASIAVALITTRASFQSQLKERSAQAILNPIDIQAGHVAVQAGKKDCYLDTPPPKGNKPKLARPCSVPVTFDREFSNVPRVVTAINYIDSDNRANTRVMVFPSDETTKGFMLTFQTWSDSAVYDVEAYWIAFQQK
jgi:hypothetical protein